MSETFYGVLVLGSPEVLESFELCFPIPMTIIHDPSLLEQKISTRYKSTDSRLKRYFVVLLESIENDEDNLYTKMEESPQILSIYYVWNKNDLPTFKATKLYYISKETITLVVTLKLVQVLKSEAEKQSKLEQTSLAKIYMRQAEKINEWFMASLRAEPCHILIIPLNTDSTNLFNTTQYLQDVCAKFGFPSAVIRSLDDYIPKSEIYDKLPYGKLLFEYEDPKTICRWLRQLAPIRMYLYGNEKIIPYEWSKQMITNEVDRTGSRIINDEDWCTFIENEPISDNIKWNFFARHGQTWQITQLTPIKLNTLDENIRFRSALRRSNITYHSRMSTVTIEICQWFDACLEYGYLTSQFELTRRDKTGSIIDEKPVLPATRRTLRSDRIEEMNALYIHSEKDGGIYSVPYSVSRLNEINDSYSDKTDRIYLWLDDHFDIIQPYFQTVIHPNQWKYFSNVSECQTYILNQQLRYKPNIYLISSELLAEQLFTYEHVSKIHAAYLYSNQNEIHSKWINHFPVIRAIYKNLDALFQQFSFDITTNFELTSSHHHQQSENDDPLPISFYNTDQDGFNRHRLIMGILLVLPRRLEARQEMIDELHRNSDNNLVFIRQINDFDRNYHANAAIQWYTRDSCLYRLINRATRSSDINLILKYRFFIIDLYQKLGELHDQIVAASNYSGEKFLTYYRGQSMSSAELDQFKQHVGSLISINTFFSTTSSLDVALMYAGGSTLEGITTNRPVIFSIEVDSSIKTTRPFANINFYSTYEEEDEVLFALGSVFSIEKVDSISINDDVPVIHLKMIDENDLQLDNASLDLSELLPEQKLVDPVYVLVGLTPLFEINEQCEHIKSILEDVDVQFFEDTDDLDAYTRSLKTIQSFLIFIHNQLNIPERYQQLSIKSYGEKDTHFNDLIYQLLSEMEKNPKLKHIIKDLYTNIANVYRPSNESSFYVQLLLNPDSKKDSEERLKTKFPSSSIIPFYHIESCHRFLESITEPNKIGNAILIIQYDHPDINDIIDQFEQIDSIKHMYICSKHVINIPYRRIIHGKFQTEDDLYTQLYSDNLFQSFVHANQQIDLYKNKTESNRYFQQTDQFYDLLKEHQNQEK